jgi:hypothetical protein
VGTNPVDGSAELTQQQRDYLRSCGYTVTPAKGETPAPEPEYVDEEELQRERAQARRDAGQLQRDVAKQLRKKTYAPTGG